MRKAVFPGSFDPFTNGHFDIVSRALPLFDEIVVAIGHNSKKKYLFDLESRKKSIQGLFENNPKISVQVYEGLTVDYCLSINAPYILRGLRNSTDFEYERNIGQMNKALQDEIETVFFLTRPALSAISSTIVRDIYKNGGNINQFIPLDYKIG